MKHENKQSLLFDLIIVRYNTWAHQTGVFAVPKLDKLSLITKLSVIHLRVYGDDQGTKRIATHPQVSPSAPKAPSTLMRFPLKDV